MTQTPDKTAGRGAASPARAWARALELTTPITRHPDRILPRVIAERAAGNGDAPALLSERECLTYAGLVERANRYSRWAIAHGLAKSECVGLLMPNRPEFMAIWLGITQVGGVVALLNTNLTGASLAHAVQIVAPKHLIVASELVHALESALPQISAAPVIWVHGAGQGSWPRLDQDIEQITAANRSAKPKTGLSRSKIAHFTSILPAPRACPKPPASAMPA